MIELHSLLISISKLNKTLLNFSQKPGFLMTRNVCPLLPFLSRLRETNFQEQISNETTRNETQRIPLTSFGFPKSVPFVICSANKLVPRDKIKRLKFRICLSIFYLPFRLPRETSIYYHATHSMVGASTVLCSVAHQHISKADGIK